MNKITLCLCQMGDPELGSIVHARTCTVHVGGPVYVSYTQFVSTWAYILLYNTHVVIVLLIQTIHHTPCFVACSHQTTITSFTNNGQERIKRCIDAVPREHIESLLAPSDQEIFLDPILKERGAKSTRDGRVSSLEIDTTDTPLDLRTLYPCTCCQP